MALRVRVSPAFAVPATLLFVVVAAGAVGPLLIGVAPNAGSLATSLIQPQLGSAHPLGTDRQGHDILVRLMYGARVSISLALIGIAVGAGVGTAVGIMAGYYGGWLDRLAMQLVDLTLSLPMILVALVLAALLGPGTLNVIIVMAFLLWARFARQVRTEALVIREQDFVSLARVAGLSDLTIMRRHVLPGTLSTLSVIATLQLGAMIVLESSLSFLGVGVPPDEASWGSMISQGITDLVLGRWWPSVLPATALSFTVLSLNLLGDWLRDALDPRLRVI